LLCVDPGNPIFKPWSFMGDTFTLWVADVKKTDYVLVWIESQKAFDLRVVGSGTGTPHRSQPQGMSSQQ